MVPDDDPERRKERKAGVRREVRWDVSTTWQAPSREEIARRFEELIHRRWHRGEGTPEGLVLYEDVWIEMDLPGVEERTLKGRLEVRVERGSLRVRISKAPQS